MDVSDKELGIIQSKMHKDFFDRAIASNKSGYYLEAILLEYAAIEGRLEVILGILGLPCNKNIDAKTRKDIAISARIDCLNKFRKNCPHIFNNTKLEENFFSRHGDLKSWISLRNTFVHGLYKNAPEYVVRTEQSKEIADSGLKISRKLYNEAKRLHRLLKAHPEAFDSDCRVCQNKKCVVSSIKED